MQNDATLEWHAHQVPITEILKDGKIIAAQYGTPETLDPAGAGQVLEPAFVAITAHRDALELRVADLEAQLAALQTESAP